LLEQTLQVNFTAGVDSFPFLSLMRYL